MYDFTMATGLKMILKFCQHLDIFLKCNTLYGQGVSLLAKMVSISKKNSPIKHHFLIPHPGNGNIGDQAMCDAFAAKFNGVCDFIVEDAATFNLPSKYESQITLLEIPNLIYGRFFGNFFALLKLVKYRHHMKSLSLIGADVMDGCYNVRASVNRLFLLQIMNSLNVPTRVTGFSWSADPKQSPQSLIKNISGETKLLVRDSKSSDRLRAFGISEITECADLAFSDQSEDASNPVSEWIDSDKGAVVGINISGLSSAFNEQSQSQIDEYVKIAKHIKGLGYRVLVIPHVFRAKDGDIEVSRDLFRLACDDRDFLISEIFTPAQERNFIRKANFLVTGRMHVAIIGLSVGVPAIALETMGKVEGLFELFGNKSYCIPRDVGFSRQVMIRIDELHHNHDQAVRKIEKYLPSIRALSSRNFEGL
jgi:polysaccharide pyruvyl transferase WcaK-like protein